MKNMWMKRFGLKRRSLSAIALMLVLAMLATAFPPAELFRVKEAKAEDATILHDGSEEALPAPTGIPAFRNNGYYYPGDRLYFNECYDESPSVNPKVVYKDSNGNRIYFKDGRSSNPNFAQDENNHGFFYIIVKDFDDESFEPGLDKTKYDKWMVSKTEGASSEHEDAWVCFTFTAVPKESEPSAEPSVKPSAEPSVNPSTPSPTPVRTYRPVFAYTPAATPYPYKYYTIKYELNGGTNNPNNPTTYREDTRVMLADAWKTGSKFIGWYTSQNGVGSVISVSNGDITVYARFTPYTYKINYDLAGGVMEAGNPDTYAYGEALTIPKEPTKTGYVFAGWSLSPLGTDPFKTLPSGCSGNLMLYAVWSSPVSDIVFDTESFRGATNPNAALTNYTYGQPVTLNYIKPDDKGYPGIRVAFKGYEYKFEGEEWTSAPLTAGSEDQATIDTTNHRGVLSIRAVWGTYDEDLPVNEKSTFVAKTFNQFNMLFKDEYAVVYFKGTRANADPRYVQIVDHPVPGYEDAEGYKFWEMCDVAKDRMGSDNGNTVVGLKLKDGITADQVKMIAENNNYRTVLFRVRGIDVNGKLDNVYNYAKVQVIGCYTLPYYELNKTTSTIPKTLKDNEKNTDIKLLEKSGDMPSNCGDGTWSLDYVDSDRQTVLDYVTVKHEKYSNLSLSVDRDAMQSNVNGYVRFTNSRWVSGTAVDVKFTLKKSDETPKLTLSKSKIEMSNKYAKETETIRVTLNDSVIPDMTKISWSNVPKGIAVEKDEENGTIKVTGQKKVEKGDKVLTIKYNNNGVKLSTTLKITVTNKSEKEGLILTNESSNQFDAICDNRMWLKAKIDGFAGDIESVDVRLNDKCRDDKRFLYKAKWDGKYIILSKRYDFVYQVEGYKETIRATLTTGRNITCVIKIVPRVSGEFDFYANDLPIPANTAGVETTTKLYCNYLYRYATGPHSLETRLHVYDLDNPEEIPIQFGSSGLPIYTKVFYTDCNSNKDFKDLEYDGYKIPYECTGSIMRATINDRIDKKVGSTYKPLMPVKAGRCIPKNQSADAKENVDIRYVITQPIT